jgi:hypothetical protein
MNTFFPTLQLFFESGRSCTIDGGSLRGALVGLDPALRFKLTDCAHEEEGRIVNSILPERFAHSGTGLVIQEVIIAQRTSIAVKPAYPPDSKQWTLRDPLQTEITTEVHTVIGLKLRGMDKTAYIWAMAKVPSGGRVWGDVRIAGLRDDAPIPSIFFPGNNTKPGAQRAVVIKDSLIERDSLGGKDKRPARL